MTASFAIEEADKLVGVDEVSVDAHGQTERRVHVEGLSFQASK
jgi:hypothetical protein